MQKTKSLALILGVLTMSFLVGYLAFAWTGPTASPPEGNVPAPLNVGNVAQTKVGGLILNTGGAPTGLIVQYGNVGIGTGTAIPGAKLDIQVSVGSDAVKINTFKIRPISNTELGIYDSGGNLILILD